MLFMTKRHTDAAVWVKSSITRGQIVIHDCKPYCRCCLGLSSMTRVHNVTYDYMSY